MAFTQDPLKTLRRWRRRGYLVAAILVAAGVALGLVSLLAFAGLHGAGWLVAPLLVIGLLVAAGMVAGGLGLWHLIARGSLQVRTMSGGMQRRQAAPERSEDRGLVACPACGETQPEAAFCRACGDRLPPRRGP